MIKLLDNIQDVKPKEFSKPPKKDELKNDFGMSFENVLKNEQKKPDNLESLEITIEVKDAGRTEKNNDKNTVFTDEKNIQSALNHDRNKIKEPISQAKDKKEKQIEINVIFAGNEKLQIEKKPVLDNKKLKIENEKISGSGLISDNSKVHVKETKTIKIDLSRIDANSKDKIRTAVKDLRSGRIDQDSASKIISEVLSRTNLKEFQNIDKNQIVKVNLKAAKEIKPEQKAPLFTAKNLNSENIQPEKKNIKITELEKKDEIVNPEKKEIKKSEEKPKVKAIEAVKEKDPDTKEIKNEPRNDFVLNKLSNLDTGKDKSQEIQKVLSDNKEIIFDNIAKNTKIIMANNDTKFSTMIRPEELGRIDMKFTMKDGKIDGRMIVQNQEAADFFRANVEELRAVFQKSNVEMGNIDIALAGQGMAGWTGSGAENNGFREEAKISQTDFFNRVQKTFDENNAADAAHYSSSNNSMINIFI
jgi:flagellar hook-length control protein FliK